MVSTQFERSVGCRPDLGKLKALPLLIASVANMVATNASHHTGNHFIIVKKAHFKITENLDFNSIILQKVDASPLTSADWVHTSSAYNKLRRLEIYNQTLLRQIMSTPFI